MGMRVLELGAGIGRFTGLLAATAARVHAVDFMQNLIDEARPSRAASRRCAAPYGCTADACACALLPPSQNERVNKGRGNTTFEAADVMAMTFEADTYDFVFTNWLFMYLGDAELAALAPRLLRCLPPGGRLFFRESCNRQSGDRSRAFNPSHYRAAADYTRLFEATTLPCGARFRLEATGCACSCALRHFFGLPPWQMRYLCFELSTLLTRRSPIRSSVRTYVELKGNPNQIYWMWRREG